MWNCVKVELRCQHLIRLITMTLITIILDMIIMI
jgi:hypothetical protein